MTPEPQFIETPAGVIRYIQAGEGPDVLLLHGAITSLEDMALGPFSALTKLFRVTAVDRPGHGETPRRRLEGAPSQQAATIREAVRALELHLPVVVGQSFGAALALDYALNHPEEIRAVVVISPIAFPELRLEHLLFGPRAIPGFGEALTYGAGRWMDAFLLPPLWEVIFAPQAMPETYRARYPFDLANGPDQMLALGEEAVLSLPDLAAAARRYPDCQAPVIILSGTADRIAAPELHALGLASLLPRSDLRMLPGLGHMLHHFAIDEVVAAVEDAAAMDSAPARPPDRSLSVGSG